MPLGKRSRRSCDLEDAASSPPSSARSTRAKRRAIQDPASNFVIASDEEENPFVSARPQRQRNKRPRYVEDIDDLSLLENSPPQNVADEKKPPSKSQPDQIPTTPRHRDNLGKKIAITPRHRVGLLARPVTPQSARTPITPRTSFPSVYNDARNLFKGSIQSSKIIGRERERSEINSFIENRFKSKRSGCIYVSGPPGTGKSALINEICDELKTTYSVQSSYCNCMSVKSVTDVFATIFDDFGVSDAMEGTEMAHLKKIFHSRTQSHLIILDEIDHLLDVDITLLYQLFEWSLQKSSSLVLVGIANALDLTDRFLPRLKSKNMRPYLVPFMPYSITEITTIVSTKLKSLLPGEHSAPADFVPFIHPTAIMFLAKKVAAQTGDLRKAFAICLRALDLIESETYTSVAECTQNLTPTASPSPTKTPLTENPFLSSPSITRSPRKVAPVAQNPMTQLKAETAPRATIAHVARVTAAVFSNGLSQRLAGLNIQQKAALCALAALESHTRDTAITLKNGPTTTSKSKGRAPTIRSLYDVYARLCRQENALAPLTATEFRDILAGLETLSLVSSLDGKNGTLSAAAGTPSRRGRGKAIAGEGMEGLRVASCVGVTELKAALKGVGSNILLGIVDGDVY
jgi:cell division control protein 6